MNGDQTSNEILRAIGSLEKAVEKLSEDMESLCDFKDELLATRQEFRDYKEIRKDLPDQISQLQTRAERLENSYSSLKTASDGMAQEVATIKAWASKASGVQLAVNVILIIVVAASPFIIWWLGAR